MADAGKDPIPEFKKSISMAKKFKNVKNFMGKCERAHTTIYKQKIRMSYYYNATVNN